LDACLEGSWSYLSRPVGPVELEEIVVAEPEPIEVVEELEIVVVVVDVVEDDGAGVAPASVGPTAWNARSFVRIRIESKELVPRSVRSPKRPSTSAPLKTTVATKLPFSVTVTASPLIVSWSV